MTHYYFQTETSFQRPIEDIFDFFSKAENLGVITPPHLQFKILTPLPIEMKKGTLIEYQLKIYYIPFHWITEIIAWEPPYRFTDTQLKGPYRRWIHEHRFEEIEGGTKMTDRVEYAVPGGIFAPMIHQLFVKKDIQKIFSFRQQKCQELFQRF